MRAERGFALIVVLLVMAIVGVVGAEFAYSMRLEATAVRAYKDRILASHLPRRHSRRRCARSSPSPAT